MRGILERNGVLANCVVDDPIMFVSFIHGAITETKLCCASPFIPQSKGRGQ